MGNTASQKNSGIIITLTNRSTDDPIYISDESVECTVQFVNTQEYSNLKLEDAYVEIVGLGLHTSYTTNINADGTTSMMPIDEQHPFFSQRQSLLSILTQVDTNKICQTGSTDKWPFRFTLPGNLPPSLPPTLVYCIRVVLEVKTWRHRSISHSIPITVYPRVDISNYLYHPHESSNENRKDVHLHAIISQSVILPGTHLPIQYDLHNPKQSTIEGILVRLYQHRRIGTSISSKKVIVEMHVPNVNKFQGDHLHDKFELTVPDERFPPTLSSTTFDSADLLVFSPVSITYELEMAVKLHGVFTNFALTFPLTMNVERSEPPSSSS